MLAHGFRDRAEPFEHLSGFDVAHRVDPLFVHRGDVVSHVRRCLEVPRRRWGSSTVEHGFGPDDVGDHVLDGPAGQDARAMPFVVRSTAHQVGHRIPFADECLHDPVFGEFVHGVDLSMIVCERLVAFGHRLHHALRQLAPTSGVGGHQLTEPLQEFRTRICHGCELHAVGRRVVMLVVEPERRDLEVLVDEYRRRTLQRVRVDRVDHPAAGVREVDRCRESSGVAHRLEGLVRVTEHESGVWNLLELGRELSEKRTFQVGLKAFLRVGAECFGGVVTFEPPGVLHHVGEQVPHHPACHPFPGPASGRSVGDRGGEREARRRSTAFSLCSMS